MKNDKRQMENDKYSPELPIPYICKPTFDRGGSSHHRADEVRAAAAALASLEVSIARRRAALAGLQDVGVHPQTHRTSCFAPLKPGFAKNPIEPFAFRCLL